MKDADFSKPVPSGIAMRLFLAAVAAVLLTLAWLPALIAPAYQFELRATNDWWNRAYVLVSGPDAGAHVDLDATSLTARLRLISGAPKGTSVDVPIGREGRSVRLAAVVPVDAYFQYAIALVQTVAILLGFLIAIRLPALMGLAFLVAVASLDVIIVDRVFANLPDLPFAWLTVSVDLTLDAFPSFALLVFAARLPDGRPQGRQAVLARVADALALAGFLMYAWIALTRWPFREALYPVMILLPPVAVLALAALLYVWSRGPQRARIAVVLGALIVYQLAYYLSNLSGAWWNPRNPLYVLDMIVDALILPIAVAYAAFRYRLLDLGFVLNRTAVIGITSALLVPIFGVLEWIAERFIRERNRIEGIVAELAIVVVLVSLFRVMHNLVDRWVDAFVFRERHADEVALENFAHRAAFYTKSDAVVDDALACLRERARVTGATLYLRADGVYAPEATTRPEPPPDLDVDDAAAVALRADGKPLDLHRVNSRLDGDRAYPLMLASRLQGIVVLGPRRGGEEMPPDIDRSVIRVVDAVGTTIESIDKERLQQEVTDALLEAARARRDAEAAWRAIALLGRPAE